MDLAFVLIALAAGFLPALFWLWFWLREDRARPEPFALIATAFIAGAVVVPLVLPIQQFAETRFSGDMLILTWVIAEEVLKYSAALIVVLWHRAVDEPIDALIYMITIALGFAAFENALFIWNPLAAGQVVESVLTGHFRFLGATLVHVLASGTIGAAMALAFYRTRMVRVLAATLGLCIAIALHALFNFSIMNANGETILGVFLFVWAGIIALILVFETVKRLARQHTAS